MQVVINLVVLLSLTQNQYLRSTFVEMASQQSLTKMERFIAKLCASEIARKLTIPQTMKNEDITI